MVEAWAASVVAAVAATDEVLVVSWALANMATAPATMMLVKRILSDLEESTAVIKLKKAVIVPCRSDCVEENAYSF